MDVLHIWSFHTLHIEWYWHATPQFFPFHRMEKSRADTQIELSLTELPQALGLLIIRKENIMGEDFWLVTHLYYPSQFTVRWSNRITHSICMDAIL